MLADEPTGNLDSKSANVFIRLLISLNRKSKRTVILITHNPEYLDYADRIFFMQDGKVIKTQVNSKVKNENDVMQLGQISDDLKEAAVEVGAVGNKAPSDNLEGESDTKIKKSKKLGAKKTMEVSQLDLETQTSNETDSAEDLPASNTEEEAKE
jgi:ABC-type multidrug transport system ATPase subunit